MDNRDRSILKRALGNSVQGRSSYVGHLNHFAHGGGFVAWFFLSVLDLSLGGLNEIRFASDTL
jgi:hypothetical protein